MREVSAAVLDFQAPNISTVIYAVQNDKFARHIVAQLTDGSSPWTPPAGAAGMIRYLKPDGTAGFYDVDEDSNPAVVVTGSTVDLTLVEQALTVPGDVYMQLNFYGTDGAKLTTFCWVLRVQKNVLTDATIISSDYYNVLSAQIAAVLDAAAALTGLTASVSGLPSGSSPTVNVTGGSGGVPYNLGFALPAGPVFTPTVDAAGDISWTNNGGLTNPTTQNIKGPQGVSVTGTTKVSGTSAPGTTDVYRVDLDNGSSGGTFDVYNGADGQGAPGSQTPQTDSGSGVVGSAIAYSREDHRHPLNVDATVPEDLGAAAAAGSASTYARRDHVHANDKIHIDATITSLPVTISNALILADTATMESRVYDVVLGTPSAIESDLVWTTAAGSVTFSGTLASGESTTISFEIGRFVKTA